jgi:hypothetical protein
MGYRKGAKGGVVPRQDTRRSLRGARTLGMGGVRRDRMDHVCNDPVADTEGVAGAAFVFPTWGELPYLPEG